MHFFKGLAAGKSARISELVSYQDGSIVSREIIKKSTGSVTIFAFDEGQGLSEHAAPFDALVQVVEGDTEIVISGHPHRLQGGEMILMPAGQPHALKSLTRFKMILLTERFQSSADPVFPSFVFTLAATGTTLSISMFSSAE